MLYALEHPDGVERLALVSPAAASHAGRAEFERRFAERSAAPEVQAARRAVQTDGLRERNPEAYRQRMFELSVAGYFHDWRQAGAMTPFRITGRTQQEVWESLGSFDLRPRLSTLKVPAVVVHGEDDPIPIESARETARLLGAAFHQIPACGHVPQVEAPDALAAALDPFLPKA